MAAFLGDGFRRGGRQRIHALALIHAVAAVAASQDFLDEWLENFGHDAYEYPAWISQKMAGCDCKVDLAGGRSVQCHDEGTYVDWRLAIFKDDNELTWCIAKQFLLEHMPEFDLHYLPGPVSVQGTSMLDDNIAFTLMALNMSALSPRPPLPVLLSYLLPYASYHEARSNWRPIFFAKYAQVSSGLRRSRDVVDALISGGPGGQPTLMNWTKYAWKSFAGKTPSNSYELGPFSSGTAPPVIAPFDFLAYGYGSCTAWSTFLTSALKAVGVPARQVGSPCWNTGDFKGLATENPNVTLCWHGGKAGGPHGGGYLWNHNWVEYWDNEEHQWKFLDVATSSSKETTWFCGTYSEKTGCDCSMNAGQASQDHDIFAVTWSPVGDSPLLNGGPVLDTAQGLKLSSGQAVSPLVWSPRLTSPIGQPLKDVGLRLVNRTEFYRCKKADVSLEQEYIMRLV
eukprot:TRINITY_DN38784_c0_g2_i1.p1 TRINITY_DN38784_c0_g2~~TRINITY_DN38784_c0_g2_i1.p1  ORF type:complete len:453 (+),score=65.79 TRINITY_DN38784_c0_g2_i1:75-1433(+)